MNDKTVVKNINKSLDNSVAICTANKYVIFSDLHYNKEGGRNDSIPFLQVQREKIFPYYLNHGYRGISSETFDIVEAGSFDDIWDYHPNKPNIRLLSQLLDYDIPGNHNRKMAQIQHQALAGWKFPDAVRLYSPRGNNIGIIIHGYQADRWNSGYKLTACINWIVGHIWASWQDKTRAASNFDLGMEVENYLIGYANAIGMASAKTFLLICGHTHQAKLFHRGKAIYANSGCMVKPNGGHCLEIEKEKLRMVKWNQNGDRIVYREYEI